MKFDSEAYSITIRKEEIDDEILYVGRVAEFPNISIYEEDFVAARNLVIDAIQTLKRIADESHKELLPPYLATSSEYQERASSFR